MVKIQWNVSLITFVIKLFFIYQLVTLAGTNKEQLKFTTT